MFDLEFVVDARDTWGCSCRRCPGTLGGLLGPRTVRVSGTAETE